MPSNSVNTRYFSRTGLSLLVMLVFALFMSLPASATVAPPASPTQAAMQAAIAAVKPALVRIHVVTADYSSGREMKEEAFGSGVIISKEGYVITNHHVAGDATYVTCTLADKEEIEADAGGDRRADGHCRAQIEAGNAVRISGGAVRRFRRTAGGRSHLRHGQSARLLAIRHHGRGQQYRH